MANAGHIVYTSKFSTVIDAFEAVSQNTNLNENDLRVFMFLCCRLNSKHFAKIDTERIADSLDMSKKKVKECIEKLITYEIVEKGNDEHIKNGYKFTYTDNYKCDYDFDY